MKYWQKARNYRKYERENGMFVYIVTVDEDVEVSAEVYQAYSQADRRERYQAERDETYCCRWKSLRRTRCSYPI